MGRWLGIRAYRIKRTRVQRNCLIHPTEQLFHTKHHFFTPLFIIFCLKLWQCALLNIILNMNHRTNYWSLEWIPPPPEVISSLENLIYIKPFKCLHITYSLMRLTIALKMVWNVPGKRTVEANKVLDNISALVHYFTFIT